MASFLLNEMWKWSVRNTQFYHAGILKNSLPFLPWKLFGCKLGEIGQVTFEFLTVCIYIILSCWLFLCPAKKHAENVFTSSLIVLLPVCFDDPPCWGASQNTGVWVVGITAGDVSAMCWGNRRSLTLPRYAVWPFTLSICVGAFFVVVSFKYTDLEELSNLSFHYFYILSSLLFPVQCH